MNFESVKSYSKLDVIGKLLLDNNPNSSFNLRNLVLALIADDNVKTIVKDVTGDDKHISIQHALAYFIGQLSGIELSESSTSDDDGIDPNGLLDNAGSKTNEETCQTARIFMLSTMSARTKKTVEFDPKAGLYDYRSRPSHLYQYPDKVEERRAKLRTALAALHLSQSDVPPTNGPSSLLISHGIRLMLDMRGTSDNLLEKLAKEGICRPAGVL